MSKVHGDIEQAERFLVGCARALRARGIAIVFNAGEVWSSGVRPKCLGACLTHAQDHIDKGALANLGGMALPIDAEAAAAAWDAIERGFDGLPARDDTVRLGYIHPLSWHRLGSRLRKQLQPVDAATIQDGWT